MLKEFKAFILRGNAVDLAVGVVIGAAFGTVVKSIVDNLLTPLTTIPGETNFGRLDFQIGGGDFNYGQVLNDIISLLLVGAAIFFFVVKPLNRLEERRKRTEEELPVTRPCPECLSEIPREATRCAHCAVQVPAAT